MQTDMSKSSDIVWTLLVRLIHWLVALCVLVNFFNETGYWHRLIGYFCLGLVLCRIANGLWFSQTATSKLYLPGFDAMRMHLKALSIRQASTHAGHNPLGQYAVYAMWLLIILLGLTGWISRTDIYWGEDWPVDMHAMLSFLLQGMVLLHVLAIGLVSKLQGKNLIRAMIRGK